MGRIRIAGSCPFELFGKPATSPLWLRLVLVDGARNRFLRVENAGLQITEPFRYRAQVQKAVQVARLIQSPSQVHDRNSAEARSL